MCYTQSTDDELESADVDNNYYMMVSAAASSRQQKARRNIINRRTRNTIILARGKPDYKPAMFSSFSILI